MKLNNRRLITTFISTLIIFFAAINCNDEKSIVDEKETTLDVVEETTTIQDTVVERETTENMTVVDVEDVEVVTTSKPNVEELYYYFAQCVLAEAGNQDELGKILVIDVILNRADKFDMSYEDVIHRTNQFAVVANGSIHKQVPTEEVYNLILSEFECRTNSEVLYFRTSHYHDFGTPMFKHGAYYFSK